MKKSFFILLIVLLVACNSDDKKIDKTKPISELNKPEQMNEKDKVKLSGNFYKHLKGKIGTEEIVADILKTEENITIIYHKNKSDNLVSCSGKIADDFTFDAKEMVLQGKDYEIFEAKFVAVDKITGTWSKNNKKLNFELYENYKSSIEFETYSIKKEFGKTKELSCTDEIILYFPKKPASLQKAILKIFFEKNEGKPEELIKQINEEFVKNFTAETFEISWSRSKIADIIYNDNNLLCYAVHWGDFMGGVHPNSGSNFYLFDSQSAKQLTIKDIIIPEKEKELQKIIYQKIKDNRDFNKSEMSIYEQPFPLTNFYINKKGIGFYYNSYDIAAYVYGQDDAFIPYKEIKNLLNKKKLTFLN